MELVGDAVGGRARLRGGSAAGAQVLRRRRRLRRAVPRGSTPRGGAGPRRRARKRPLPRRARLHDPAPAPEARRGDAVAGSRPGAARADRRDRGERRARGRVPLRRDDRRAADGRRRLLLHGDEHAHPGRAHGHGARHRPRPRARADPDRAGGAALAATGGRRAARARDRVPDQRRGRRQGLSAGAGRDHGLRGAVGARRARRLRRARRGRDLAASTTR